MVRLTDSIDMTIVVDWDVKPQIKQANRMDKKVLIYMYDAVLHYDGGML